MRPFPDVTHLASVSAMPGGCHYLCAYNNGVVANASFDAMDGDRVLCTAPSISPHAEQHVRISLNGQQYTQSAPFLAYSVPFPSGISPSAGPVLGGTLVTLTGSTFVTVDGQLCQFGSSPRGAHSSNHSTSTVHALALNDSHRLCVSPSASGAITQIPKK